ncbi:MAG: antitoxin VbhA family protein [Oscillospiraceae bacterium]|jgi:hypothetical protein|nr:antitoxin VbhA family protein [Oscillospiraceae bacterium]
MESKITTEQAPDNAAASVEMEGFTVTEETCEQCRRLLDGDISFEDYIEMSLHEWVSQRNGVFD